jgi:UDP-N-acetylglucosamine 2-epimerase (non-hydrolysing)
MSPIIRELVERHGNYCIIHTGQHYSINMDKILFDCLKLPLPNYNLNVGSGSHAEQTAKIMVGIEKLFNQEKPDIILVQGDTNTVLAAALTAAKLCIKVGHVEAGLRSYNSKMPEEVNRVLTDHCSDYLFPPGAKARTILVNEGISVSKIFVTGNTIVDAVYQNLQIANSDLNTLRGLNLSPKCYFLLTIHRQENVDDPMRFKTMLEGLRKLASVYKIPVIWPIHPRSKNKIDSLNISTEGVILIEPLDFLGFLQLENNAKLILTDSGGVQEEACILGVPCVTLREDTERPETLDVGANMLAGAVPETILKCVEIMLRCDGSWPNPFGNGQAAKNIIKIIGGDYG